GSGGSLTEGVYRNDWGCSENLICGGGDAFRALLNAPSTSTPRSNGRLALGSGASSKSLGHPNHSELAYKPPSSSLKPRKVETKNFNKDHKEHDRNRGGYRDRALERRQGLNGDFAEAETLLENFQARVAAAGTQVDKDLLEQQTKYLGGDERHTILVKGLDHALFERRKAELSQAGKLDQVTDDDLEEAFEQNLRKSQTTSNDSFPNSKTKKLNRQELLEELRSSRDSSKQADLVVVDKLKAFGKFKPIGSANSNSKEEEERQERKRRKAEKKKKKALKAQKTADPDPSQPAPAIAPVQPVVAPDTWAEPSQTEPKQPLANDAELVPATFVKSPPSGQPGSEDPTEKASIPEGDEDFDIFGDAGEYKGLDTDNSDDDNEKSHAEASSKVTSEFKANSNSNTGKKRKTYFEDDAQSEDTKELKDEDDNATMAHKNHDKVQTPRHASKTIVETDDEEPIEQSRTGESMAYPTRLEALSDSMDIGVLLAIDAAQEKEEKRKAKKQKKKADGDKLLTDKDRLNKDVMEMERYLKKKQLAGQSRTDSQD
ncbi:hypothetical protein O181_002962, partial [Austropuccinia psidii MF-1]|nr:hypothetical protein [Austropuccinia psidii MF-1]